MRHQPTRWLLMASILLVASTAKAFAQGAHYAELPNFHQVNAQLYRGAQPKAGGLEKLKAMGIRSIVNLRGPGESTQDENADARALGLRYYDVPLPEFSQPSDTQVQQILDIINTAENQPVFVHCRHGQDRTGTIIACYRITHDGWTGSAAKKEAVSYGMSWTQVSMKKYIDKFYKQRRKAAGSPQAALTMNISSVISQRKITS
jgi:tyrosine-protein phosphatase SIW14